MEFVRTDDSRFLNLPEFPFSPNYVSVSDGEGGDLRMHYLDEAPQSAAGEVVLCMHGQPSWSFLYRKMIPGLVAGGARVIAPDLIGFGKSDKPTLRENYTYANHVAWVTSLIEQLDLTDITLFCQDWGGLIGLRVAAENPQRFARIITANTGLPDADGVADDQIAPISDGMRGYYETLPVHGNAMEMATSMAKDQSGMGFLHWVKFCAESPGFDVGELLNMSSGGGLSADEQAAYSAPFPDGSFMAGARQFPSLVPIMPDNPAVPANRAAWQVFSRWQKPFLTSFSDSDPVTAGAHKRFQETVPGAKTQTHKTVKGAGHFLQETAADELVQTTLSFIADNPL